MSDTVTVTAYPDCDVCKTTTGRKREAHYDARTIGGPWAYMCNDCWLSVGIGQLGTGYGQRLVLP